MTKTEITSVKLRGFHATWAHVQLMLKFSDRGTLDFLQVQRSPNTKKCRLNLNNSLELGR